MSSIADLADAATEYARDADAEPAPAGDALIGHTAGGLRFDRLIGCGGMGAVYAGRQLNLDRAVAIKVIASQFADHPGVLAQFEIEARMMARLIHPHITACRDFTHIAGPDGKTMHVLVMELVDGGSLGQLLRSKTRSFTPVEALDLHLQAASALALAHGRGLIHRDIKPDNLLIGSDGVLKVTDFGLTELDATRPERQRQVHGSPAYLAPELCRGGSALPASDIYALGCSLFLTLTGRLPFLADDRRAMLRAHLKEEPPALSSLLPVLRPLDGLMARCLAKDPADRFADGAAVHAALREARAGFEPRSTESSQVPSRRRTALRTETPARRTAAAVAAGATANAHTAGSAPPAASASNPASMPPDATAHAAVSAASSSAPPSLRRTVPRRTRQKSSSSGLVFLLLFGVLLAGGVVFFLLTPRSASTHLPPTTPAPLPPAVPPPAHDPGRVDEPIASLAIVGPSATRATPSPAAVPAATRVAPAATRAATRPATAAQPLRSSATVSAPARRARISASLRRQRRSAHAGSAAAERADRALLGGSALPPAREPARSQRCHRGWQTTALYEFVVCGPADPAHIATLNAAAALPQHPLASGCW